MSERRIFDAVEVMQDHDSALQGEADFIVLAQGRGILAIEAKSPGYVEYRAGDWHLDHATRR